MTNLDTENLPTLNQAISDQIDVLKYNPASIQGTILDHLEALTENKIDIIDPTSPFIFLLEASSVNASACVNESLTHLREQYPALADTDEELYKHMSDTDYLGRFSSPSAVIIDYTVSIDEIFNKGIKPVDKNYKMVTIPRNTEIIVEETVFLLQYPVDIKIYIDEATGVSLNIFEVSYQTDVVSELQNIYTKLIEHSVITGSNKLKWLHFSLPLKQLSVITNEFTVSVGEKFEHDIENFDNKYYYAIVYNKSVNTGNEWVVLETTHAETIYDIATPMVKLKVVGSNLNVTIPPIYTTVSAITGSIRVDLYTTKGELYLALKDIGYENWAAERIIVDASRDTDVYTGASSGIDFLLSSTDTVHGGTNGWTYNELRERVIYNTTGLNDSPITTRDLTALVTNTGFNVHKAIDLITERVFTVSRPLPNITSENLETKPDITRQTLNYLADNLLAIDGITSSGDNIIIPSNTLFEVINDIVSIVSSTEVVNINALNNIGKIEYFIEKEIYYSLFHYVLDRTDSKFSTRAYSLSYPSVDKLNFESINEEFEEVVNTGSYTLEKTNTGYTLVLNTISNSIYQDVLTGKLKCQIRTLSVDGVYIYWNSISTILLEDDEREFTFNLDSLFDIDSDNNIIVTNGITDEINPKINLTSDFDIMYTLDDILAPVTTYYVNDELDLSEVSAETQAFSKEILTVILGESMEHLWTRSNLAYNDNKYLLHNTDKPAVYSEDQYTPDPITGRIFTVTGSPPNQELTYNVSNTAGSPVVDGNGDPVYEWKIGDVVLDADNKPTINVNSGIDLQFDVILSEAEFLYTTLPDRVSQNQQYMDVIKSWLVKDLEDLNLNTLELTKVEYLPTKTSGTINGDIGNGVITSIESRLTPTIQVYVNDVSSRNQELITTLNSLIVKILTENITGSVVNMNLVKNKILELGDTVIKGVKINDLGNFTDSDILNVVNYGHGLKIGKKLITDTDGVMDITFNVEIDYVVI